MAKTHKDSGPAVPGPWASVKQSLEQRIAELERERDEYAEQALIALAGAVGTPENGYVADGGPSLMAGDIRRLREDRDSHRRVGERLQAEVERLRAECQALAKTCGCLEPGEDGHPCCDPPCLACRNVAPEEGKDD